MAINFLQEDLLFKVTARQPVKSLLRFLRLRHLSLKEGEKQESSTAIYLLPKDLLIEILARLPVKSLLRVRSVAKSWRDIVKEPTFVVKHHITQVALNRGNCVLTRARNIIDDVCNFCLLTYDEQGVKCTNLETPFLRPEFSVFMHSVVAGPCNGLVIIPDGDDLFLCNPATREYKVLPRTSQPCSLPEKLFRRWFRIGFGIDPITKDYKIVRIWNYFRTEDDRIHKAEVLSLSANSCRPKGESWKIIDAVPPILLPCTSDQVYLNGKYYWCDERSDGWLGRHCSNIVWFDMGAQVFGLIELSVICSDPYWNKLGVLKDSLVMIRHAYKLENKYMYQVWIMDEQLSWTKYADVGPFKEYEVPLGFLKNNELVVLNRSYTEYTFETFSYDVKKHVIKEITQGLRLDEHLPLCIYNESVASIMGED